MRALLRRTVQRLALTGHQPAGHSNAAAFASAAYGSAHNGSVQRNGAYGPALVGAGTSRAGPVAAADGGSVRDWRRASAARSSRGVTVNGARVNEPGVSGSAVASDAGRGSEIIGVAKGRAANKARQPVMRQL